MAVILLAMVAKVDRGQEIPGVKEAHVLVDMAAMADKGAIMMANPA
jgi:hypothetical protein